MFQVGGLSSLGGGGEGESFPAFNVVLEKIYQCQRVPFTRMKC